MSLKKLEKTNIVEITRYSRTKAYSPKLEINEKKLVLWMSSKINAGEEDTWRYRMPVAELKDVLGIKDHTVYDEFKKAATGLMNKIITRTPLSGKGKEAFKWCDSISISKENGFVELGFGPHLKPILLLLKKKLWTIGITNLIQFV